MSLPGQAATSRHDRLAWSSYSRLAVLICTGAACPTALRIAFVVGTLLSAANQGAVLLAGDASWATAARIIVNYLVPFTVASFAYLAPFRGSAGPAVRPVPGSGHHDQQRHPDQHGG